MPNSTQESPLFRLHAGTTPLLVNVPHAGTTLPPDIGNRMTREARALPDTDWHVDRLYDFARDIGAGMLVATHSRYLIDLNRPPGNDALYSTRTTGLVPLETFDGSPVYRADQAPDEREVEVRRRVYWTPYHEALEHELLRLKKRHGFALLLDAHSIRSEVPALFTGRLPVFSLGSNSGASAAAGLIEAAAEVLASDARWDLVIDGRFRGGHITRHYGQPGRGVHALQLEMAQRAYMDEKTGIATAESMDAVRVLLERLVTTLQDWRPSQ